MTDQYGGLIDDTHHLIKRWAVSLLCLSVLYSCNFNNPNTSSEINSDQNLADDLLAGVEQKDKEELPSDESIELPKQASAFLAGDLAATPCESALKSNEICFIKDFQFRAPLPEAEEAEKAIMSEFFSYPLVVPFIDSSGKLYRYVLSNGDENLIFAGDGVRITRDEWVVVDNKPVSTRFPAPTVGNACYSGCCNPGDICIMQCLPYDPCKGLSSTPSLPPSPDDLILPYPTSSIYAKISKKQPVKFTVKNDLVAIRIHMDSYDSAGGECESGGGEGHSGYRAFIYAATDPAEEYAYLYVGQNANCGPSVRTAPK